MAQNAISTLCICKFRIPTHTFPVNSRRTYGSLLNTHPHPLTVCLIDTSNLSCQNLKSWPLLLVLLLYSPHVSWHCLHPSFLFVLHPISSHIHHQENLFAPSQRAALLYLEHNSYAPNTGLCYVVSCLEGSCLRHLCAAPYTPLSHCSDVTFSMSSFLTILHKMAILISLYSLFSILDVFFSKVFINF